MLTRLWSWLADATVYLILFLSATGIYLWSVIRAERKAGLVSSEPAIRTPVASGDVAIARDLMQQLGVVGEIGQIERSGEGHLVQFLVTKPGRTLRLEADFRAGRASVKETRVNSIGVLDALHRFTGVRPGDPDEARDWLLTRIWSFAMDALAIGLCVMVLTGLYLWYRLAHKRRLGLLAFGSGVACCTFFVFALARIF